MGRSADLPRTAGRFDGDDTGCTKLHVDMDAFYASVEIKKQPHLRGRPVVVGGGHRGVVAAASYEARRYGVRSAMSMSQALRRCPHAVVLPPDRAAYQQASAEVMSILRDVTPLVEPLSLDEAFLDIAGALRRAGRPVDIAVAIRAEVERRLELTCSVGVASTKFVAKLASARCKPDGLLVVPHARVLEFLHPLPVTALWGVGAKTGESLHRLGIRTVADLDATPLDTLRRAVGVAASEHLSALARGDDPREVNPDEIEKSISAENTLDVDLTTEAEVALEMLRQAEEVSSRIRARSFVSRTVGIKIRFADFRTVTRVRTLPDWTDSSTVIFETARELYRGLGLDRPRVRLVGVRCENLQPSGSMPEQLSLDLRTAPRPTVSPERGDPGRPGPTRAIPAERPSRGPAPSQARPAGDRPATDRAVDAARARFGAAAVRPASLLGTRDPAAPGPEVPRSAGPRRDQDPAEEGQSSELSPP